MRRFWNKLKSLGVNEVIVIIQTVITIIHQIFMIKNAMYAESAA